MSVECATVVCCCFASALVSCFSSLNDVVYNGSYCCYLNLNCNSSPPLKTSSAYGGAPAFRRFSLLNVVRFAVHRDHVAEWFSISGTKAPATASVSVFCEPDSLLWNGDWSKFSSSGSYPWASMQRIRALAKFSHVAWHLSAITFFGTLNFLLTFRMLRPKSASHPFNQWDVILALQGAGSRLLMLILLILLSFLRVEVSVAANPWSRKNPTPFRNCGEH